MDKKADLKPYFNVGHMMIHFNNFRFSGELHHLIKAKYYLDNQIKLLEAYKKGDILTNEE
jgi:hypothetical protein